MGIISLALKNMFILNSFFQTGSVGNLTLFSLSQQYDFFFFLASISTDKSAYKAYNITLHKRMRKLMKKRIINKTRCWSRMMRVRFVGLRLKSSMPSNIFFITFGCINWIFESKWFHFDLKQQWKNEKWKGKWCEKKIFNNLIRLGQKERTAKRTVDGYLLLF